MVNVVFLFVIFSINVMNSIAAVGRNFTGDLLFVIVSLYVCRFRCLLVCLW